MSNLEKITEELSKLSIIEASQLVEILEKKWNIKNPGSLSISPKNAQEGNANENSKVKTQFDVELIEIGPKKIQIIKGVREITGVGLKEAKDIVDSAPKVIKSKISKIDAEEIKTKLEKHGAKIKIL